jgi:hypothetical protein
MPTKIIQASTYIMVLAALSVFAAAAMARELTFAAYSANVASGVPVFANSAGQSIMDGDLVRADGDYKVYIVKISPDGKMFKRWISSPAIFGFYGHLQNTTGKIVTPEALSRFTESDLVQVEGDPGIWVVTDVVPGVSADKQLIQTANDFTAAGFDWSGVFAINSKESSWYGDAGIYGASGVSAMQTLPINTTPPDLLYPSGGPEPSATPSVSTSPVPSPVSPYGYSYSYPSSTPVPGGVAISFDGNSFAPADVNISHGTGVTFANNSSASMHIMSNPHPSHADLPGLDSGIVPPGGSYTYIFGSIGDWGFHNEFQPVESGMVHART